MKNQLHIAASSSNFLNACFLLFKLIQLLCFHTLPVQLGNGIMFIDSLVNFIICRLMKIIACSIRFAVVVICGRVFSYFADIEMQLVFDISGNLYEASSRVCTSSLKR